MDSLLDYDQDLLAPPWGSLGRDVVLGTVATVSKLLLNVLNTTCVINHPTYTDLVMHRPPGVGLLTISNHTSTYDDPGLPCALLPLSFFWTEHTHHNNRWTMCAQEICFTNHLFRQFFLNGKVLPVSRGAGVDQASVSVAARALGSGDWLHIFPEGRVVPDGRVGPFRQGIGKLICEARAVQGRDPIILPLFHSGMSRVMPFKSSIPRVGQQVEVSVGQPLDLSHITCRCNTPGEDQPQVWRDLAVALRQAVAELAESVPPNPNQLERPDVAEYERRYQERQRRAREQQRLSGAGPEPTLMLVQAHEQQQLMVQQQQQQTQQQGAAGQEGGWGTQQQPQQQQQQLVTEQEWQQQQQQLLAVIRRVSRQAQLDIRHTVDSELLQHDQNHHQQEEQQQYQQQRPWRQQLHKRWQQGRALMHTWQQHQDWQVGYLLALRAQAKAAGAAAANSNGGELECRPSSSSSINTRGGRGWGWAVPWLPFASSAAAASTEAHRPPE